MIEFQNVVKSYGNSGAPAVRGLNLRVEPGEIFGFLGPNGAGKTTTIKMLVGILRPDSGRILVGGVDMAVDPLAAKRQIGYVPDGAEPHPRLTGREYIEFIADIYQVPDEERDRRLPELLEAFELTDAFDDRIDSYSRGMRQKIAIVGALIHQPKVWVLDEPMVGLDPRSAHVLKEKMRQHCAAGNTVFFSTHVLEVAERLCDRVAIIRNGQVLACGTLEHLKESFGETGDASLEDVFLELTAQ
jgi:ABC-2 type transport system ATP-binding protein